MIVELEDAGRGEGGGAWWYGETTEELLRWKRDRRGNGQTRTSLLCVSHTHEGAKPNQVKCTYLLHCRYVGWVVAKWQHNHRSLQQGGPPDRIGPGPALTTQFVGAGYAYCVALVPLNTNASSLRLRRRNVL